MKSIRKILGISLAALLPAVSAQAQKVEVSAGADFKNKYLGAVGIEFEQEPVAQSWISANSNGFYGTLWTNFNRRTGLSEIDYIAGVQRELGEMNIDLSYAFYDLRELGEFSLNDNLQDLVVSASPIRELPVTPRVKVTQNLNGDTFPNEHGRMFEAGMTYSRDVSRVPVTIDAGVVINNGYYSPNTELSTGTVKVSTPFGVKKFTITPAVKVQKGFNGAENNSELSVGTSYNF